MLLEHYVRSGLATATAAERRSFERLLELPDPLLAAYLFGRADLDHAGLDPGDLDHAGLDPRDLGRAGFDPGGAGELELVELAQRIVAARQAPLSA